MAQPIPKSLLKILSTAWKPDPDFSFFESNFNGAENADRRAAPTFVRYQPEIDLNTFGFTFKYTEVEAIQRDGFLGDLIVKKNSEIGINEHAECAIHDFFGEVYEAWEKLQSRLQDVASSQSVID